MSTEDIKRKYKRLKISGIILTITGIITILFGLFYPFYNYSISVGVLVVGIVLFFIGVSFWVYSLRQIASIKIPELYPKRFKRQKISGICLFGIGTVYFLSGIIAWFYGYPPYGRVFAVALIPQGIFFISLGVGLWVHSVSMKEKIKKKLEESSK